MNKYDMNKLSLEEKIGQMIVFGFDALELNDHAIDLITKYKVGNVILFARNVKTPEQVFKLNHDLQKLALKTLGVPLLITIDQEGGMVTRIKSGGTFFPGAMTISASDQIENSYLSGRLMGKELKALGINMNLAPTLDVNNNPFNPVIGVRSYSDNPNRVAEYGLEFIKGLQESVIATAKHFPGHGDTKVDSHLALPEIDKSLDELMEMEIIPFKHAVENGLEAVMTTHINFPQITKEGRPATLSKIALTGLLREKLGFEGLIITDCMQMKAIQKHYTTPLGTLMAINAGANLICISHSYELQTESVKRLKQAYEENELTLETINDRVSKILEYKEKYASFKETETFEDIKETVLSKANKEFAYSVVKDAFTKVVGDDISLDKKTLLIASNPISTTIADEDDGSVSIIQKIKQEQLNIDTLEVSIKLEEDMESIIKKATLYEQVIFCSYNANIYQNQLELEKRLNQVVDLQVVMMRNPYDTFFNKDLKHVFAMYEYTPNSVNVLVEYLKGQIIPKGKMVVSL